MAEKKNPYVHGTRPVHVHTADDDVRWECNSPYCQDTEMNPPEKGGPMPVISGQEPWRGRS